MTSRQRLRGAAAVLISIALFSGARALGSGAADSTSAPDTTHAKSPRPVGDPAIGKKFFLKLNCALCHKADGSGGVRLTGNPTPNWRDAKRMADPKYNNDYLRDCITNGKMKSGMVAWGKTGQLKPAEIEHVIAYIRTFSAKK
jgi:mono/diheme cytochrome c family protein